MDNANSFSKYVDLIMSMGLNYKMGSITKETFLANLEMILNAMQKEFGSKKGGV